MNDKILHEPINHPQGCRCEKCIAYWNELVAARPVTLCEWEIVLSGGHPDIFVIVSASENATDAELQSLAETEAMAKTYIWSKKRADA